MATRKTKSPAKAGPNSTNHPVGNGHSFPSWLPEWVVRDYARVKRLIEQSNGRNADILDKLVFSEKTQKIWQTFAKRQETYLDENSLLAADEHRGTRSKQEIAMLADLSRALQDLGLSKDQNILWELWMATSNAFDGAEYAIKFSRTEIAQHAARIKRATEALRESLAAVDFGQFREPFGCLESSIGNFFQQRYFAELAKKSAVANGNSTSEEDLSFVAAEVLYRDFLYLLDALIAGCDDVTPISFAPLRTSLRGSKRLFFLKAMRDFFEDHYGTPLHETNLAIASLFFDCDGLTATKVAKITSP